MSILVNTHNDLEEKVLIAFLESLKYEYKSNNSDAQENDDQAFLTQYNLELEAADNQIEVGDFIEHDAVERLFASRRNKS